MIINIKRNKEPILWREQIEAEIESLGATPNYGTITAELSRELNVPIENLRIKHAYPMYGKRITRVIANLYNDPETLALIEDKKKKAKKKSKEPKTAAKK